MKGYSIDSDISWQMNRRWLFDYTYKYSIYLSFRIKLFYYSSLKHKIMTIIMFVQ